MESCLPRARKAASSWSSREACRRSSRRSTWGKWQLSRRTKGLLMAFKLLDLAQLRWRRLDGAQLLPLVRAGLKFVDGVGEDRLKTFTHSPDSQPREAA